MNTPPRRLADLSDQNTPNILLRFCLSGGLSTALYAAIAIMLGWLTDWTGMRIHLAGFMIALPVSYLLQRNFAFRSQTRHSRTFPRFAVTAILAFVLSTSAIHYGIQVWGWPPIPTFLVAIAMVSIANFMVLLLWVFVPEGV